jgi:MerR family transcriptional regulator, heat shock protein HspR
VGTADLYQRLHICYTSGNLRRQVETPGKFDGSAIDERSGAMTGSEGSRGVYAISVAAELTGAGVQNLRVYERHGLVEPSRTEGGTRRYSEDDLARITRVLTLLGEGLNLAGVALVLRLEDDNARLRQKVGEPAGREGADR